MVINKTGKYRLIADFVTTGSCSVGTIPKGTVIEIKQVDEMYHQVIGPDFFDWHFWDLPVEEIT
jgi:hypothetical protein